MSGTTVSVALVEALLSWKRNGIALGLLVVTGVVTIYLGSSTAYYVAALVAFSIWMGWFVATGGAFLRRIQH